MSFSAPVARRNVSSALTRVDFGQLSARRFRVEPGQKPRHGHAVALMGGPRSRQFRFVLYSFHERDGILADFRLPACLLQGLREKGRRRGGVEEDARPFLTEPPDKWLEVVRLEPFRELAETVPDGVRELPRIEKQDGSPLGSNVGETEGKRRMRARRRRGY